MTMDRKIGQRIIVVGTTGAGKTTCARALSQRLGYPHIELDAMYWGPNWTPAPTEAFRQGVAQALSGAAWVADGNYRKARDVIWARADTLVWLDYALPVILWQLLRRALKRIITREELWGGNRETWRGQFLSRDSLFLWALTSHPRHCREYPVLLARPDNAHLSVVRLRSPRATREWLAGL
jgi:adenylate kinase family enzyme